MNIEQASYIAKRVAEIYKNSSGNIDVHVFIPNSATQDNIFDISFACMSFPNLSASLTKSSINVIIHE